MLLETLLPQRRVGAIGWRWANNFGLSALTWYISTVAGTWFLIWLADNQPLQRFALLPGAIRDHTFIGFVLLLTVAEFLSYWIHRTFHHVSFLWPIHAVHHADTRIDVSTSYRHHPVEPLLSIPIVTPVILSLGVGPTSVVLYQVFAVFITVFSHANIRLPQKLDNLLRLIVVTPGFHHLHHCSNQRYTNSNYGTLIPWFDYLFRTASTRPLQEQATMEIGLEYWRESKDLRLDQQLLMPLRRADLDQNV